MLTKEVHLFTTEPYVSSPPANHIIDPYGNIWMLGINYGDERNQPRGHYHYNVLKSGVETGEYASHIERRFGKIRIFTRQGWKVWNGNQFS